PQNLVDGIFAGITESGSSLPDTTLLIHGSTVVINAVLERKGAKTALITTQGFSDIYEIGRVNRPDSFNLLFRKHRPLIPAELRFEVEERMDPQGVALIPFNEQEAVDLAKSLAKSDVEAVAIVFLHSYRNPDHEQRMVAILAEHAPGLYVTASHEVSREYREFERTSTVAVNAFVGPRVSNYLDALEQRARGDGMQGALMIMQSNGGMYDLSAARRLPVQMIESGPAAGVAGTQVLCETLGISNAICFDMGGTTAKACVIEGGRARTTPDYFVGGYETGLPVRISVLDIQEVGTGGGSLARRDPDGGVHVGPESAGAEPGPVCYGHGGTEPTVTDANVVLGRIDPNNFLGGTMKLNLTGAEQAIDTELAKPLNLTIDRAALGVLRIANTKMANAVRAVTTAKGLDPRDFVMFAFGGAGPLHATDVARELGVGKVIVPPMPGHFSAYGMLLSSLRRDYALTLITRYSEADFAELERACQQMTEEGERALAQMPVTLTGTATIRTADMRYRGQEHTVTVTMPPDLSTDDAPDVLKHAFDVAHEQQFSHSRPDQEIEIVTLRIAVLGEMQQPPLAKIAAGSKTPSASAGRGTRRVLFEGLEERSRCRRSIARHCSQAMRLKVRR
ncbi:MAG: hydantoinase/oxoprolinase family protein, partial [Proteobacteria bacterium]|nr:hydantoinase/oxoprolinase family protein [Pseudomonadota bacterium]